MTDYESLRYTFQVYYFFTDVSSLGGYEAVRIRLIEI